MPAAVQQAYDEVQRWRRERRGQRSSNFAEMGGLMHLSPQSPAPELQLMLVTALLETTRASCIGVIGFRATWCCCGHAAAAR